jgi:predicted Zn-dependent protease
MDFKEWLNNVDDSGRSRFDYLDDFVESAALVELMEEAFNAGKEVGWTQAGDYL